MRDQDNRKTGRKIQTAQDARFIGGCKQARVDTITETPPRLTEMLNRPIFIAN